MICKKCGMDNPKGSRACIKCGAELSTDNSVKVVNVTSDYEERVSNERKNKKVFFFPKSSVNTSKFSTGFFVGLCFNILGLLGAFFYDKDSTERQTYFKGWLFGFISSDIVASIVTMILYL